ncbi:hypothetical protein [Haloarchaeobius sp. TZWSO28]|uniref:hypothetical protein n=1 Tax=unclassified Haloarchaeobius TaxID=2614452 RepID=UPI003EBE4BA7
MQGGLSNGHTGMGSAYSAATSVDTPDQPVTNREAVRIGGFSLTFEELLALAVIVNAGATLVTLYLEVA